MRYINLHFYYSHCVKMAFQDEFSLPGRSPTFRVLSV